MKILLINPNTSQSLTDRLTAVATAAAAPDCEIIPVTAPTGVPYIATRTEAVIGAQAALELMAQRHTEVDGAIIAAFGDPGLGACRELFDIPVVGLAEAGMLTACMLGKMFGIVTFAHALGPWYRECVEWHQLQSRCAGIRMLDQPFEAIENVQEEKEDLLVELARCSIIEDDADVIILAGAPLAGLAHRVRDRIPVPIVDCAAAAIRQIELLVSLNVKKATAGTFRRPDAKSTIGLDSALAARIERR